MKLDIARVDTRDYLADNAYGMPLTNKKEPGLMKDKNNGARIRWTQSDDVRGEDGWQE